VLVEWNHTAADVPAAATIPTLFARQAAATPDATALIYEQHEVTYRELAARADGLAAWLRQRGVRRGATVAVSAPRSPELVVALLGVLQTGAAYLPLDPSYPADCRQLMLTDSGARLCLTGTELDRVGLAGPADHSLVRRRGA
jgi:non-ribosomal peptide synthetase component F